MTNVAKGLSFFCLGFLIALFSSFSDFSFRSETNQTHSDNLNSSLQSAFRLPPAVRTVLLPELNSYIENQTAQGEAFNLQETIEKLQAVIPGFAAKLGLDNKGVASLPQNTEFQKIIEAKRCIAINDYYNKHSKLDFVFDYFALLKTVSVDYCDNQLTEENIISVLKNVSLNSGWELKKSVVFDNDLSRVLDGFAKKNNAVAKAYSLFYVAIANDALDNGYYKLAVSFLNESKNIFASLPAQERFEQKLDRLVSGDILADAAINNSTNFADVFSKFIVFLLVALTVTAIIMYFLHRKYANEMDIDYLMQRYDWDDELSLKQAVSKSELEYDVVDTASTNNSALQENITTEYFDTLQQDNPKIISFHKDKHGKGTGKNTN